MHALLDGFSGALFGGLAAAIVWQLSHLRDRVERWRLERDIARELNAIFREMRGSH